MKRGILSAFILALFSVNAFCGTFSDLGDMLSTTRGVDSMESSIPEGRSLLPIVYHFTQESPIKGDKIIESRSKLITVNLYIDHYKILTRTIYKGGSGLHCQEAEYTVSKAGDKYSVNILRLVVFDINGSGQKVGEPYDDTTRKRTIFVKNVVSAVDEYFKCSDEDYKNWEEIANADEKIHPVVEKVPQNRLQKKRWYEEHFPVGKEIEMHFYFGTIIESKKKGYAYDLNGLLADSPETVVCFYTNNEEFVEKSEKTTFKIMGTITKVDFSPDTSPKFKMESIYIEDK